MADIITDSHGRPMTPTHSGKSRKTQRYRYYVTRPDALDGTPAARVSAADLETMVCEQLAARLIDPALMLDLLGSADPDAAVMKQVTAMVDLTATNLRSGGAKTRYYLVRQLLASVKLGEDSVELTLDAVGLAHRLEIDPQL